MEIKQENVMIELREMSKSFSTKNGIVHALDRINLKIQKGEIFGIIGMSGAGKSTLVRCINLLERPTEGQVIFDGRDLTALSAAELRKARQSMGMIFQQFNLLMQRTALENVCFPLEISGVKKEQARKRAEELLEIVGLADRKHSYPSQLSGGQKQRVAIARALVNEPAILMADEPTGNLDSRSTIEIMEIFQGLNDDGTTIVMVTHEPDVAQYTKRIALFKDGHIIKDEPVENRTLAGGGSV